VSADRLRGFSVKRWLLNDRSSWVERAGWVRVLSRNRGEARITRQKFVGPKEGSWSGEHIGRYIAEGFRRAWGKAVVKAWLILLAAAGSGGERGNKASSAGVSELGKEDAKHVHRRRGSRERWTGDVLRDAAAAPPWQCDCRPDVHALCLASRCMSFAERHEPLFRVYDHLEALIGVCGLRSRILLAALVHVGEACMSFVVEFFFLTSRGHSFSFLVFSGFFDLLVCRRRPLRYTVSAPQRRRGRVMEAQRRVSVVPDEFRNFPRELTSGHVRPTLCAILHCLRKE